MYKYILAKYGMIIGMLIAWPAILRTQGTSSCDSLASNKVYTLPYEHGDQRHFMVRCTQHSIVLIDLSDSSQIMPDPNTAYTFTLRSSGFISGAPFHGSIVLLDQNGKDSVVYPVTFRSASAVLPNVITHNYDQPCDCPATTPTQLDNPAGCGEWTIAGNFGLKKEHFVAGKRVFTLDYETKTYYVTRPAGKGGNIITKKVNINRIASKPWQDVSFRVVNLNLFMENAGIQDSVFSFDSEPPYLLRQLFFPDSAASVGLLSRWNNLFSASNTIMATGSGNDTTVPVPHISPLQCFYNCYYSLKATMLAAYNPCSKFACCGQAINNDYVKLMTAYNNLLTSMTVADTDITDTRRRQLLVLPVHTHSRSS